MPSITALRALLGASLGLGAVDLAVIDVVLAPDVVDRGVAVAVVPPPAPSVEPLPPARIEVAPSEVAPSEVAAIEVAPVPAPAVAAEPVSGGKSVYFATMSAVLDTRARETLDLLAATGVSFILEGHADHRGDDSYNKKLSRKRALAVEDYLVEHGVERGRIEVSYKGEVDAEQDNDLWRDRRVDVLISGGSR
jgi:outer membrane protein OmpA-like peptidoglycan-associated protein